MIPRLTTTRHNEDPRWACSTCGAKRRLEVIRTEHDEDGYPLRMRRCRNCQTVFATEETPIPLAQFYPRATTHTNHVARSNRRQTLTCRYCNTTYRYGTYGTHVKTAKHLATLATRPTPASRAKERVRRHRDYWRNRGINIDIATGDQALRAHMSGPSIEDIPA